MRRIYPWILVAAGVFIAIYSFPGPWRALVDRIPYVGRDRNPISDQAFSSWVKQHVDALDWQESEGEIKVNREILETSLELGSQFIIHNQTPDGNFNYEYDFVRKAMTKGDNQVRQAGALWGLALIHQYQQSPAVGDAIKRGLQFFFKHTRAGPAPGSLLIAYPGDSVSKTGTVALVALAVIEYLRTGNDGRTTFSEPQRDQFAHHLNGYLKYLEHMHLAGGTFSQSLSLSTQNRNYQSNPYADGEALLCLIKAAKYLGYDSLRPLIEDMAMTMAKRYIMEAWQEDVDSSQTKGFFQWGSMAFWEYQDAGWRNGETFGDCILALSWWMIHTHRTLERIRNTAYAYEGIIHAYRLAKARDLKPPSRELATTIDAGLHKLTSWQVGGPLQALNRFLQFYTTDDPLAVGGVMNHSAEAPLRIDVTQHQMHAVILALRHVYTNGRQP